MPNAVVQAQLDAAAYLLQRLYHLFRFFGWDNLIIGTVKRPNGRPFKFSGECRNPASTNRNESSKPFRVFDSEVPRAVTAHAEPGKVHTRRVYSVLSLYGVQKSLERTQLERPSRVYWTLRRDDERRFGQVRQDFR